MTRSTRRKSPLYTMKVGEVKRLKGYEYGVSHISKRINRRFVQFAKGSQMLCVRTR